MCYVLIDNKDGKIENICSGCISLLGLNIQKITKYKIRIQDIINDFYQEIEQFLSKQGIISKVNTYLNEDENQTSQKLMQVQANSISFN